MQTQTESKPSTTPIPYLHKKINLDDLHPPKQLLFTEEELEQLRKDFKTNPYYDKEKDIEVIKHGDKFYAIYGAHNPDKCLGKGAFGSVRLIQDLETGDWFALKKQENADDTLVERENKTL